MGTLCGAGASSEARVELAVGSALAGALATLGGAHPGLGFLFVSSRHDLGAALETARGKAPGTDFLACTTAGEIHGSGSTHGGVSSLLVAWDGAEHVATPALDMTPGDPDAIAARLCEGFEAGARERRSRGLEHSTTVLFGDGLSPKLEKLVAAVRRCTSTSQQVVGGGAADDGALARTWVGSATGAVAGGVLAAHVFSRSPFGVGVEHGVGAASERMLVTHSTENVVHELDGRPALDVYRDRATSLGLPAESAQSPQFLVENELGLYLFEQIVRIRSPIGVSADGSVTFAGEVPEGSAVCFVRGQPDAMIAAARTAARTAAEGLGGTKPAGVLVVSCICRDTLLGPRYDEEIRAIAEELPGAPIAGFVSYGEIARIQGKLDGYHNNTLVVVAIPC
jgi:hypothetical protein